MSSTRIVIHRYPALDLGRTYYKSRNNKLYCKDVDGSWYFCSKDGEPQEKIDICFPTPSPYALKRYEIYAEIK